jgi:hypothetical protein
MMVVASCAGEDPAAIVARLQPGAICPPEHILRDWRPTLP